MKQRIATVALAVAALAGAGMAAGPTRTAPPQPKIIGSYQAGSDPELPAAPPGFKWTVDSLAFSPDEQWIAVAVRKVAKDGSGKVPPPNGILLLLPIQASGKQQRVQIDSGSLPNVPYWSPSSDVVAIQGVPSTGQEVKTGTVPKAYNLRGELIWTGPPLGRVVGFIEPGRLFALRGWRGTPGFDTVDIGTSAVTRWPAKSGWRVAAVNPDRRLVAVFPDWAGSKVLLVDYATRKILRSIENQTWFNDYANELLSGAGNVYFAENGKSLCSATILNEFESHAICRDIDTGKTIAELRGLEAVVPADASSRGSRMVLTESNYFPGRAGTYRGNVVWDFRSGIEVAAWGPSSPRVAWHTEQIGVPAPASVAISPSGHYVAERFGDELQIYQLP